VLAVADLHAAAASYAAVSQTHHLLGVDLQAFGMRQSSNTASASQQLGSLHL